MNGSFVLSDDCVSKLRRSIRILRLEIIPLLGFLGRWLKVYGYEIVI